MTSPHAKHWSLDPEWTFLNHGSFGATPNVVMEEQRRLQAQLERQPVRFFAEALEPLLDAARTRSGSFVGCDPDDLALVSNATQGVSTVLKSLRLEPGDELLVTSHGYNACTNAVRAVAQRAGAKVVVATIPFPIASPEQVTEALVAAATPRTRLLLVDHVTSPTGLVLPVESIVARFRTLGIDVLVDGAHAPGMLPLDLDRLGAAYYTGNLHKWLCTPKGSAILHVRKDRQEAIEPLSVSHGWNANRSDRSRFRLNFDFGGTDDPTAVLCAGTAIDFLGGLLPGGWDELRAVNQRLALHSRNVLAQAIGIGSPSPDSMIGSLAALPLPAGTDATILQRKLLEHRIEAPVFVHPASPVPILRTASQLYNDAAQSDRLAGLLPGLLRDSRTAV